jgi:DNA-binding NtrC family response regulator/phosphohistidine swiveling domain-containing protein
MSSIAFPFDCNRNWVHRLTRPVDLFGASLWYAWHPSAIAQEIIGTRIPDALFIETKHNLVRRYRVEEQLQDSEDAFDTLVAKKPDRLRRAMEKAIKLNHRAEKAILHGEAAFPSFRAAYDFFVEHGVHATVIPDGTVRAASRLGLEESSLAKFASELRKVSHYHRLISDVLFPIATRDLSTKGDPAGFLEFMTASAILAGHFSDNVDERRQERANGKSFIYQNLDGIETIGWTNNPLSCVVHLEGLDPESFKEGELIGRVACQGRVKGRARVIVTRADEESEFAEGDILVTVDALPTLTELIRKCSAIITDEGGSACHAAVVSREYNKPCIVGTRFATDIIQSGSFVDLDASRGSLGTIRVLSLPSSLSDTPQVQSHQTVDVSQHASPMPEPIVASPKPEALALIVEDRAEHRDLIQSIVKTSDHADWQIVAYDGSFDFDDVQAWINSQLSRGSSFKQVCLFLDLLWKKKSADKKPDAMAIAGAYAADAHRYMELLLSPEDVLDRVNESRLVSGFKLLLALAPQLIRNFSIAVVSKFGVDSLRSFARSLGASTTIQKMPSLREFFSDDISPLRSLEARFRQMFSLAVSELYAQLLNDRLIRFAERGLSDIAIDFDAIEHTQRYPASKDAYLRVRSFLAHQTQDVTRRHLALDKAVLASHITAFLDKVFAHPRFDSLLFYKAVAAKEQEGVFKHTLIGQQFQRMIEPELKHLSNFPEQGLLLLGESGTGKELVARIAHRMSNRAAGPFVRASCVKCPRGPQVNNELHSYLFGHLANTYTGVSGMQSGKVAEAQRGTLFIDEIGDAEKLFQDKLLDFLETGTFSPWGAAGDPQVADVRFIFASWKDLKDLVDQRIFRDDLWWRIRKSTISIRLPALRERKGDIPELFAHFLGQWEKRGHSAKTIDPDAMDALVNYSWPGNVRELEATVKDLSFDVERRSERRITVDHVQLFFATNTPKTIQAGSLFPMTFLTLEERKDRMEADAVQDAVRKAKGNISQAAQYLKCSREKLYKMLQQHLPNFHDTK